MSLCSGKYPLDFGDSCVRASWGAFVPGSFVFALCVFSIPVPKPIRHLFEPITRQFRSFLTLQEAEALDAQALGFDDRDTRADAIHAPHPAPLWRTIAFAFVGTVETLWWLAHISYLLYDDAQNWWTGARALILALVWLYTVIRPITRPTATLPFDVVVIYLLLLGASILELGGILYDYGVYDNPLPGKWTFAAIWVNLFAVVGVLGIVLRMPFALPSERVKKEDIGRTISQEDYATLWSWITFWWVYPIVRKGRAITLNEDDVWNLSPTQQSRPMFAKFSQTKRPTLLRRLWATNSLDFTLDFCLTLISVGFKYAGPFFLMRILDEIDNEKPTRANKGKAYIYAFLAFACTLAKAQADVQHLWFNRRAATRIRSELTASIYEKALKRKDYSGVVNKDKDKGAEGHAEKKSKSEKEAEKEKADDPKAGADVGKIVNLMSGDVDKIRFSVSGIYLLYSIPVEITTAGVFLYRLLGSSAFVGFAILLLGSPLNNALSKRAVRIHKGVMTTRDKRMGVVNELIGAVKFIKFFAWEDRWIQRALDARENEMKWMVKARSNSILLYSLWTCTPIFISIGTFFAYVAQGNNLTISTAFTAITLFSMIREPLNTLPGWIVLYLQTGVSIKRISVYLDEDEVSEQVSSLKKDNTAPPTSNLDPAEHGVGFIDASFKWNEVPEDKVDITKKDDTKGKSPETSVSTGLSTLVDSVSAEASVASGMDIVDEDHRFELRDLNIRFPEGALTVVTGPTGSGKTALMMALLGEMTTTSGKIMMDKDPSKVDSENGLMHSMSYAAQLPWLQHRSIKDNILFGYPFDEERYKAVVEACALGPDLDMLEDGDETEIGARGVSLSGGQKARVALARAVYARTKCVLLDDPLSAVDSHTSRFLYEHLLRGPLLADRTVILVTHHVELVLPGAYYLVRMLDGRIDTHGTIKSLRAQGILDHITHDAEVEVQKNQAAIVTTEEILTQTIDSEAEAGPNRDNEQAKKDNVAKKPRKLIEDEHRETGSVKWKVYKSYLKASSYWTWVILGTLMVITELLAFGDKFWIKTWGEAYGRPEKGTVLQYVLGSFSVVNHEVPMDGYSSSHSHLYTYRSMPKFGFGISGINWPDAASHPYFYIGIYAVIGLSASLVNVLSISAQFTGALRASRILFKKLLETVVRATFRFHDTTPQGRMLNRFSKDIETIDMSLAGSLQSVNSSLASFFAAILAVTFVFPSFLIPAFFIGFAYRELAIGYLNTGRDLRRMESNTRSPIFSDFGELLEGIVTVRAFSVENRFLNNIHGKIDVTTKMWYTFWMTNRWLLLNFDALGGLSVLVASLFSIAMLTDGAGWAGLCITSAMTFTVSVYWACRNWTELELNLNSVERVVEYLDLPQEPPAIIESNRVPAYWPSSANNDSLVIVENLTIKYAPE
ncbi:hypothetical protein P691DRAFT_713861, partial [Macrolepiota fuliginosa MF-IS2]